MGKRGGIRQRLEGAASSSGQQAEEPEEIGHSIAARRSVRRRVANQGSPTEGGTDAPADLPLLHSLKRDWSKGILSAKQVQEYAEGASRQGAVGMDGAARAGSHGKHAQNMHRSLVSLFGRPKGSPEFCWYQIPTSKGPKLHPFMMPHLWFSALFAELPDKFADTMKGPDDAACSSFWTMMADTPFLKHHPHMPPQRLSRTLPVGLYGDAGSFSHQESLYVFTWNSLLGVGQTMAKRFLTTCIRKSDLTAGTFDAIFRILGWSFNVLLTGITPSEDWQSKPLKGGGAYLAGGYSACLTQVRGDWEFYCSIFSFPRWNGAENMCWMCDASAEGPLSFANFAADAPWRATRRTHEVYVAKLRATGRALPALFEHVAGLRLECVMVDILHTVDQGVALHIIGNVFHECLTKGAFCDGGKDANLVALNAALVAWYKRTKETSRIKGKLTHERIKTSKDWPKLKCKAAAARHVAPFALELAREHLGRRVIAICQLLCEFYMMIDDQGMFLDPAAKVQMPLVGKRLCGLFAQESVAALREGQKNGSSLPKCTFSCISASGKRLRSATPGFTGCMPTKTLSAP